MADYLSDVEIAQSIEPKDIRKIAGKLGLSENDLALYGRDKAKITADAVKARQNNKQGKLILVTAITPTPAGEGKTTTTVGLGDAFSRLGKSICIAIREPSLGPCFGIKGGAAGGGYAQVIPMEDINLHFTGDFHAITTAHNLLSALLDNHIHQGNALNIDLNTITWKRVMDMNERALRNIIIGVGGKTNGVLRESGFDITAASEIMALLCLASDLKDLESRLSKIVVAYNKSGEIVTAKDLNASGALAVVLKDAIKPNIVQTLKGTPALVHGGPFGNIAHGCNSIIATKLAMSLADYVITEAGFGSDLGAEKFFDIKCRAADIKPSAAVVVATIRALKMHGGVALKDLSLNNPGAVSDGIENLKQHCQNMRNVGLEPIVAINKFPTDTDEEIAALTQACKDMDVKWALSDVWAKGGKGGIELANLIIEACETKSDFHPLYELNQPILSKVETIAVKFYGADGIDVLPAAFKQIKDIERLGFGNLPVCIAKTQSSLSDDPKLINCPSGYNVVVREAKLSAGAGFVVIYAGNIMTMPGLPKSPAAERMGLNEDGEVVGLF